MSDESRPDSREHSRQFLGTRQQNRSAHRDVDQFDYLLCLVTTLKRDNSLLADENDRLVTKLEVKDDVIEKYRVVIDCASPSYQCLDSDEPLRSRELVPADTADKENQHDEANRSTTLVEKTAHGSEVEALRQRLVHLQMKLKYFKKLTKNLKNRLVSQQDRYSRALKDLVAKKDRDFDAWKHEQTLARSTAQAEEAKRVGASLSQIVKEKDKQIEDIKGSTRGQVAELKMIYHDSIYKLEAKLAVLEEEKKHNLAKEQDMYQKLLVSSQKSSQCDGRCFHETSKVSTSDQPLIHETQQKSGKPAEFLRATIQDPLTTASSRFASISFKAMMSRLAALLEKHAVRIQKAAFHRLKSVRHEEQSSGECLRQAVGSHQNAPPLRKASLKKAAKTSCSENLDNTELIAARIKHFFKFREAYSKSSGFDSNRERVLRELEDLEKWKRALFGEVQHQCQSSHPCQRIKSTILKQVNKELKKASQASTTQEGRLNELDMILVHVKQVTRKAFASYPWQYHTELVKYPGR